MGRFQIFTTRLGLPEATMERFRRLFKRFTLLKKRKEEEWASFVCRLVCKVVDGDDLEEAIRHMEICIAIFLDGGKQMLLNHLFTKLYIRENQPRRCIPKTLSELTRVLDSFGTLDRDHPDIEDPPEVGDRYSLVDVIYHMKETAKLDIDMSRVSEYNGLIIVAIMTACLCAVLDKDCWPRCVRATGLAVVEQIPLYIANRTLPRYDQSLPRYDQSLPRCGHSLPPPPGFAPRVRATFEVGPDDNESKQG